MPTSPNFLSDEAARCAQHGLRYQAIPVPWEKPTRAHLQEFFCAMEALGSQRVLVHCALNKRVSAFMFLWRVLKLGEPVDAALADLHRIWTPEPQWQEFIDQNLRGAQE